jgi:spore germination protein YaaH
MAVERAHIARQTRYVLRDGGTELATAVAADPPHSASWQRMTDD